MSNSLPNDFFPVPPNPYPCLSVPGYQKKRKKDEKEFTTSVLEKVEILSEQDFGKMLAVNYLHVRSTYIEEIPYCNIN